MRGNDIKQRDKTDIKKDIKLRETRYKKERKRRFKKKMIEQEMNKRRENAIKCDKKKERKGK